MSNELVESNQNHIMSVSELTQAMQIVFPNLFKNEYELGVKVANEFGLNPLKREIYLVGYGTGEVRKLSIIIGYEVFLKRAERIGTLDGWSCETYVKDEDLFAKVVIHRKDRKMPFVWEVNISEYDQHNKMWKEKPRTMLKKVCIAQAFRLCFPEELGGMPYTADELPPNMSPSAEVMQSQATVTTGELPTLSQESDISKTVKKAREIGFGDLAISAILKTDDWENAKVAEIRTLCEEIRKARETNASVKK